jgi:putative ATPase
VNQEIERSGSLGVPFHIRNAPTGLMKQLGYGKGYQYDHDAPERFSGQECLPEALRGAMFYKPVEIGFEREIAKRMQYWENLRRERKDES